MDLRTSSWEQCGCLVCVYSCFLLLALRLESWVWPPSEEGAGGGILSRTPCTLVLSIQSNHRALGTIAWELAAGDRLKTF